MEVAHAGDPGLFGPRSVTWQLHSDPMMWVAGVRALYFQALHPRAVRGVMQNSNFRAEAWSRLMRIASFVSTTTYGTEDAAEKAGARVRKIHSMLSAVDPGTGERYGVDEPELLLWVHCAEIDSYLHVLRRSGYPITDTHADRYIREHQVSARLVGLDPDAVPANQAQMRAYFEKVRPELAAGAEAREVDDFLLRPPTHPLLVPAREVMWRRVARLAYASLPPYAHELYGRAAAEPATVTRQLRATGTLLRRVPARVYWQLPNKDIPRAMSRLGPGSRPAPYRLGR
ncbi:oxygenase MpaB family protein [Streptomyces sp. WI04-05B]|uniref:oxygenase MpaB family protein n=1 Tax=Streptomyces TaxID=1883 RepID=UPI0029BD851E|nr:MULTISPECIES: oxygenase MpaB family protein [unclassified Streptomyces]MDX2541640.1 oxygenase MpaB family protein [Streptomyces sp. WI04-05B]MDX2583626.1 oxygenase MpaB family protein [Streptomyces sp. WI04-05A]MDX3745411.1 oxygenase MpaB family protein [Streptomyces sp. AK08-02]